MATVIGQPAVKLNVYIRHPLYTGENPVHLTESANKTGIEIKQAINRQACSMLFKACGPVPPNRMRLVCEGKVIGDSQQVKVHARKRNALTVMCVPKPVRDDPSEVEVPLRPTSDAWRVERSPRFRFRAGPAAMQIRQILQSRVQEISRINQRMTDRRGSNNTRMPSRFAELLRNLQDRGVEISTADGPAPISLPPPPAPINPTTTPSRAVNLAPNRAPTTSSTRAAAESWSYANSVTSVDDASTTATRGTTEDEEDAFDCEHPTTASSTQTIEGEGEEELSDEAALQRALLLSRQHHASDSSARDNES